MAHDLKQDKLPFGKHERACLCRGIPHYESLVSLESSGKLIERLPNIRDEQGRLLVMGKFRWTCHVTTSAEWVTSVSAADPIRYQLREIVRGYLHQNVKLSELEYQPMADQVTWSKEL